MSTPTGLDARLDGWGLPPLPEPLPRPVIDSHTHADTTTEYTGLDADTSLGLAHRVGVTRLVQVGCDVEGNQYAVDLARRVPGVVATVSIHPNEAARAADLLDDQLAQVAELATSAADVVRGIGETGLDYYRTRDPEGHERQQYSFTRHIELAIEHDLTLVIHDRDAHADILKMLDRVGLPNRIVMHCFSGDADFARECLDRGAWLSFPGVVTFGSAGPQREALSITPLDRVLVETDAPFLTPVPARGRKNAPYVLAHTVRYVADHLGVGLEQLCDQVRANTFAAFNGEWDEIDPAHQQLTSAGAQR
ncbi:TatD family hydrolase [Aestuariimicrobium sp. Y1814]|uniref:TatD family hydrolase n=1 Tax=Aestuariimicrobium sp. Y1814 TaxID=3418742 RepID=UPI003DA6D0F0